MKEQLINLVDELESVEARRALQQSLQSEGLLPMEVVLGEVNLKKRLAQIPDETFNKPAAQRVLPTAKINLEMIYREHNRRVNFAFFASVICACAAFGFFLWALWLTLTGRAKVDVFNAVASLLTGLVSGGGSVGLYRHYKKEVEEIRPIERDMRKLGRSR